MSANRAVQGYFKSQFMRMGAVRRHGPVPPNDARCPWHIATNACVVPQSSKLSVARRLYWPIPELVCKSCSSLEPGALLSAAHFRRAKAHTQMVMVGSDIRDHLTLCGPHPNGHFQNGQQNGNHDTQRLPDSPLECLSLMHPSRIGASAFRT